MKLQKSQIKCTDTIRYSNENEVNKTKNKLPHKGANLHLGLFYYEVGGESWNKGIINLI